MDTRRTPTAETGIDAARAITQLERANQRLLECSSFDAVHIETALAERDDAVRAIAAADQPDLSEPLRERLLSAFEDGRRIREKLSAFYRASLGQMRLFERMRASDPAPSSPPAISVVG
jgi:hypothetical protein